MTPASGHTQTAPILLTGFEPFGGRPINPSWEAVRQLANQTIASRFYVVARQLPVCWHTAGILIKRWLVEIQPFLVLNIGQGEPVVRLERYAHNVNRYRSDNRQQLPPARLVVADGPPIYETTLDIMAIIADLRERGITAYESTDAGGYLCNFVSYHCYHTLACTGSPVPALFVHIPPIDLSDDAPPPHQQLACATDCVAAIAETVLTQISRPTSTQSLS